MEANLDLKKPEIVRDARVIEAEYDTWTEWKQDMIGYWLIRVNREKKRIEAGFCKDKNKIEVVVNGVDGEEMYNTIIREKLVTKLQHAAYLGYELQKAEVALKLDLEYVQDSPLYLENVKKT